MKFFAVLFFISLLFGTAGGISPAPGVTMYVHDVFLMLLFIAALFTIVRKKTYVVPKLIRPMIGFCAVGLLSLLAHAFRFSIPELGQSSLYLLRWIFYAGIYLVVVQSLVPTAFWLWGLFAVGSGFTLLGFAQYIFYPDLRNLIYLGWDPHYYRLVSTFLDPNFAGIMLVITIFLGMYLVRTAYVPRIYVAFFTGLSAIALYLTHSRSSYLAFIVGLGTLMLTSAKKKIFVFFLLMFVLAIIVLPKPGDALRLDRMVTTIARVQNWQQSIARIKESPLIGFGFNSLRFVQSHQEISEGEIVSRAAAGVDSSMLFILLTTGIIGFVFYGWLMSQQLIQAKKLLTIKKSAAFGGIFLASFFAIFVHSMFVNSLFYPWIMIWMWVFAGVIELTLR